ISVIGIVCDKQTTKNGNIMITIEDLTGRKRVLINKNKPALFREAQDIVYDEVIGIVGVNVEKIIFANNIIWPDVPTSKELKKGPQDKYAIFLSDLHVGSAKFLPEDFEKFLKWINGEMGNEQQRNIAKNVEYIFIAGDLVDGVGIYPEQDKELSIKDIYEQYNECARYLKQIPSHIPLIICPGNHDAMRLSEPQPCLSKEYAKALYELNNAIMVTNPAMVNIDASDEFEGFDVLLYHGYSFDYYVANVDSLRNQGGYDRADLIMKFLLKRRHVAPSHLSTLYIPDTKKDPLIIEKVPDFFLSGHIHKTATASYRNTTLICGSCWQGKTLFQEKVGHNPEPSRVPIVNLRTRDVKILKFGQ
ncbi:MAG TPA: metallophosphoesterase, partial [Candidatus Brocadiales bacterium]|nr:metallophosphoesterase [Candidatus Brocadiales bacterium]